jgi:hypothetical protein
MKHNLQATRALMSFNALFCCGTDAVNQTIINHLKEGGKKPFSKQGKKLFLDAALLFLNESRADDSVKEAIKNLFSTDETLIGLQKEFDISIIGHTDSSSEDH